MIGQDEWHERAGKAIARFVMIVPEAILAGIREARRPKSTPIEFAARPPAPKRQEEAALPENVVPIVDPAREAATVLNLIDSHGPLNNGELAYLMRKQMGYGSDATAHRITTALESRGLVTRQRDGRQVVIRAA